MRKVAGLFAGIGGLELGFAKAGFETTLLCEIDPAAVAVLKSRFPGRTIEGDVRELRRLPRDVSILCAGFPCQDLSSSGTKAGIGGERSGLVDEVFRLLRDRPVEWVVIENVPFMLRLHHGDAMRTIIANLEAVGYRWAYRVVDSQSFGIPHRRKRVFMVASQTGDPRTILFRDDNSSFSAGPPNGDWDSAGSIGFYWTEGTYATGLAYNAIPPLKGGSTIGIPSPPAALMSGGDVITPEIRDAERLQGFPANWTAPAEAVGRASKRWHLVGNAVTTQAAAWLAYRLASYLRNPQQLAAMQGNSLEKGKALPDAAWGDETGRFAASVSHYPMRRKATSFHDFLRFPPKPLSIKATRGFMTRLCKGNLFVPEGFLEALEAHARRCTE